MKNHKTRVLDLINSDISAIKDGLHRAKAAGRGVDPARPWGASGQTLGEIIADYEGDLRDAQATRDWFLALTGEAVS